MVNVNSLKNTYFGLRHGESEANVQEIIASGEVARTDYGLTEKGKNQVRESVVSAKNKYGLTSQTIILTSPLKRAKETAEIAAHILAILPENIILEKRLEERLREREFGIFEGQSHKAYKDIIWPADLTKEEGMYGVESTVDVQKRVIDLIEELESKYQQKNILLASHGDTLQILETWFKNISPSEHRSLPHLVNAEIRKYN